ncbi:MAG TPA: hypothetical protein VH583_14800 [Vicinamibacterales bacterium]
MKLIVRTAFAGVVAAFLVAPSAEAATTSHTHSKHKTTAHSSSTKKSTAHKKTHSSKKSTSHHASTKPK